MLIRFSSRILGMVRTPDVVRLLENAYGYFQADDASFVITDLLTPRPWINVLSNDRYGLVISQKGGGFSWHDNCQTFRITRWEQDLVKDEQGRYLYVQDLDAPEDLWSSTFQPTRKHASVDRCVHGLGFTRFEREFLDLRVEHTWFVPVDGDAEVWLVELKNLSDRPRRIRLASYAELHLAGVGDWHREFHRLFMESRVVDGNLVAWKHPGLAEHRREPLEDPKRVAMSWSGGSNCTWITDKTSWLGRGGAIESPEGLRTPIQRGDTPRWDDPIAVGMVEVEIPAHGTVRLTHVIAAEVGEKVALAQVSGWTPKRAELELAKARTYWSKRCKHGAIEGLDVAEDLMVNAWLPYQAIVGRIYARCAYYQQGGAYGYRDQLQDSLSCLALGEPETTALQLGRHAEAMFSDGGVRHWWMPTEGWGPESWHSDTCLWLMFGLTEYYAATGDRELGQREFSFLTRPNDVPWTGGRNSNPKDGQPSSLLDHAIRGVRRSLSLLSPRGLPLMGAGDWNDGLSHVGLDGKGESVWLAMFLFDVLNRSQAILNDLGRADIAAEFASAAKDLQQAVEEHAWDGEWYIAGTRDDGVSFGSRENKEGKIFLNPQTWAVLSGIASPERQKIAMESVRRHLVSDYGALLLVPAFSNVDPFIGYITRYAPGLRENGGVYSHASTWAALAFQKMGDEETARKVFRSMLPCLRSQANPDLYAAEPYVMPGNIDGPDSPYAGRAGWTWYTGSAAWMVQVAARLAAKS